MINTWSKFIYGTTVDTINNFGDFTEGATTYAAQVPSSSYSLSELIAAISTALNAAGGQVYTVALDRSTMLVTISAPGNFSLLLGTGLNRGQAFWDDIGFTQSSDLTGANTYTGASTAAKTYFPQFLLQSYCGPNDYQVAVDPMVNRTAAGRTEMVRFGVDLMLEFDLQFITNIVMDGIVIKNNPTGVQDAESFLQDITGKSRFEFVPDVNSPEAFNKVICDQMPGYNDGSGYKLKEMFMQGLPGIFTTGIITLRVVT